MWREWEGGERGLAIIAEAMRVGIELKGEHVLLSLCH